MEEEEAGGDEEVEEGMGEYRDNIEGLFEF